MKNDLLFSLGKTISSLFLFFRATLLMADQTIVVKMEPPSDVPPFFESVRTDHKESFLAAVLGQLVYLDEKLSLKPGILKEWRYDFKNKQYILTIPNDLKFQNGRLATADDLEFSIVRHFLRKKNNWAKMFFTSIEGINSISKDKPYEKGMVSGIHQISKYSVGIKLSNPNPALMYSLARSYFSLVPIEELTKDYKTWKNFPVGAGPFKIVTLDKKNKCIYLEKYTNSPIASKVKKLNFCYSINFEDKKADFIFGKKTPGYEGKLTAFPTSIQTLEFNYNSPVVNELNFRQYLAKIIYKDFRVDKYSNNKRLLQILPSSNWGRVSTENIEKIYKSSKFKLNSKIENLKIVSLSQSSSTTNSLKKIFEKNNLDISIIYFDRNSMNYNRLFMDQSIIGFINGLGADVSDPLIFFNMYSTNSPEKYIYPQNDEKYNTLLNKTITSTNFDVTVEQIKILGEYFIGQAIAIPILESYTEYSYNNQKIKNPGKQNGGAIFYFENLELENE